MVMARSCQSSMPTDEASVYCQRAVRARWRGVRPGELTDVRRARLLVANVEPLGYLDEQSRLAPIGAVGQLHHTDGHVEHVAVLGDEVGHQAQPRRRRIRELHWQMLILVTRA